MYVIVYLYVYCMYVNGTSVKGENLKKNQVDKK